MSLRVYNTLTKQKEPFEPIEPGKVGMYVCGVTVYDFCHLGHARAYVAFDVIRRYLQYQGYNVKYVQNFTDIDDKIIKRGLERGQDPLAVARQYVEEFFKDMDALGIERADVYPKVTEHIAEIITMVQGLVDKGYAYVVDGDVYFAVEQFPTYGKLSGRTLEDMKAGARVDVDERKQNPMDFALWKSAKPGEPAWDSPWGQGRPGWHIECSVMSIKYLGESFDIHGGGADLIFPHHENEIAQSEAYTGCAPFARYWLHNGFVTINEEKMSKSLGNFFTIRDLLAKYPARLVRFFLLSAQYRNPVDFDEEKLAQSAKALERLTNTLDNIEDWLRGKSVPDTVDLDRLSPEENAFMEQILGTERAFVEAMDDDFNTALAIAALFDLVRDVNSFMHGREAALGTVDLYLLQKAKAMFTRLGNVLGIIQVKETAGGEMVEKLMELMLAVRQEARSAKNWAVADKIRDGLKEIGIIIEDTPQGPRWKLK